jgi:hypothetical protein
MHTIHILIAKFIDPECFNVVSILYSLEFMSVGWDNVSEQRSPTGLFFIPLMIYEYRALVEWYWQGETKELEKNLSQCRFVVWRTDSFAK